MKVQNVIVMKGHVLDSRTLSLEWESRKCNWEERKSFSTVNVAAVCATLLSGNPLQVFVR